MSKNVYLFKEFDKRALVGALILELVHPSIKFKAINSGNVLIETLLLKDDKSEKKVSGFFTILNSLNPKLSASTTDIDFAWRICYGLTFMETVIKKKKASTQLRINESVLVEVETLLAKQAFLGGKNPNELDIVIFCNIGDVFQKDLEKYKAEYPKIVKLVDAIREKSQKIIDKYNAEFPKDKVDDKKKADDGKKGEAAPKGEKKGGAKEEKKIEESAPKGTAKGGKGDKKEAPTKEAQPQKAAPVKPKKPIDPAILEIKEKLSKCKIQRLNKGQVILPSKDKKNILITSALPYVNNVPHLGNLIGCVLSGDVYARWARLRGYNTVYICGTDQYGTATETKALAEKKTPKEVCDFYHALHTQVYDWFDIDFDYWGQTSTPQQTEICQGIFNSLNSKGLTFEDTLQQPKCFTCNRFLADRFILGTCPHCKYDDARGDQCDGCGKLLDPADLISPKCHICGNKPEVVDTKHIFLDLPKIQGDLEKFIEKNSVEGGWSNNSIQITKGWIKQGLKPRCITRDLKWGVPVPVKGYEDKVFYVWFDAPIGYISITANYTKDWEKWWKDPENVKLIQFMGKDNVPFHTVIFPSCLIGTGEKWTKLNTISTTEYLNYEKGLKFSKSRGTGVFGLDAQNTKIPSEVWRYQLLINRPETSDAEFNWEDFSCKVNGELISNIGNLCQRTLSFAYSNCGKQVPAFDNTKVLDIDKKTIEQIFARFKDYNEAFEKVEIKAALKIAMEISGICNKYMQDEKAWDKANKESGRSNVVIFILLNLIRFLSAIFEPFMPSFSAKVNYILGLEKRTEADEILIATIAEANSSKLLELIAPGNPLNQPVPLFDELGPEEIEDYREKYSKEKI